jgi:hypothetical protein
MTDEQGNNNTLEILEADAQDMVMTHLMCIPVEEMTAEEIHFAWSIIDLFDKAAKGRKDDLRAVLMEEAELRGEVDPNGSFILELEDGEVKKEKRQGKDRVKEGPMRNFLKEKGVDPNRIFLSRTVTEFDPKAFKDLLDEGLFTVDEVRELFTPGKVTWALKIKKPGLLPKKLLSGK